MTGLLARIGPGCRVLFVGINPGLRSAAVGHHFAGYSNRFWKLLWDAQLVPGPITCEDDVRLPKWGLGITNLVGRPTCGIDELTREDYRAGRAGLTRTIRRVRPRVVALVGVTVYREYFDARGTCRCGLQQETITGVPVIVLPNPSGRNANFTYDQMLREFRKLRRYVARRCTGPVATRSVATR